MVDYLAPLCTAAGLRVETHSELRDGQEQHNLLAWRGGDGDGALLLGTHLDTVPPGDPAAWTACGGRPFTLTQRDGELFGLGTADVKLDFLCKLAALDRLRSEPLRRPVLLAGTYGEEVGRYGADLLVRRLWPRPALALVGEPTELRPCAAHKGYVEIHVAAVATGSPRVATAPTWRLRFDGAAAHSSQPDQGISANDLLLDALPALVHGGAGVVRISGGETINTVCPRAEVLVAAPQRPGAATATEPAGEEGGRFQPALAAALLEVHALTKRLRDDLATIRHEGFRPAHSTVNNGLLALDAHGFRHVCDVRLLPGDGPKAALERHLDALRAIQPRGVDMSVTTRLDAPPFAARRDSTTLAALESVLNDRGLSTTPELKSGTTEATVYAQAGLDTVVFGPGAALGNIHKPDEHVPAAHLRTATDVYEAVVRRLCR